VVSRNAWRRAWQQPENRVWPGSAINLRVKDEDGNLTFLVGGGASSPLTAGCACSTSFSAVVRFLPRDADFGFSLLLASPSSTVGLGFLERGLAGAFFSGGSGLPWSLMREERRGSEASALALRTIQRCVRRKNRWGVVVWFGERGKLGSGTLFNVKPCHHPLSFPGTRSTDSSHMIHSILPGHAISFLSLVSILSILTQDTSGAGCSRSHRIIN
jgi:hypothetical protein